LKNYLDDHYSYTGCPIIHNAIDYGFEKLNRQERIEYFEMLDIFDEDDKILEVIK